MQAFKAAVFRTIGETSDEDSALKYRVTSGARRYRVTSGAGMYKMTSW